ncbi:MAG: hypothetical protein WC740_06995 [Verrucomicrobiia bacterium]
MNVYASTHGHDPEEGGMGALINSGTPRVRNDSRTTSGLFWFMEPSEWAVAVGVGLLVSLLCLPLYNKVSLWVGPALLLTIVAIFHIAYAARRYVPLASLAIIVSGIQLVLAAWWSYYHPMLGDLDIGEGIGAYLSYASPAFLAFSAGWFMACIGLSGAVNKRAWAVAEMMNPGLRRELDLLIFGALGVMLLQRVISFGSFDFVAVLLMNLRYVGALGWMILGVKGWRLRVAVVIVLEIIFSVESTMFHSVVLWMAVLFCVYALRHQLRSKTIALMACAGLIAIVPLEYAKINLRAATWYGVQTRSRLLDSDVSQMAKPIAFAALFGEFIQGWFSDEVEEEFFQHMSERYNQGWIINRVMLHVPAVEPFAEGETIITAFSDAFLPRFLVDKKYVAGGKEFMRRFAGIEIGEVSMNLGYAGEMYANFGSHGGIVGVGIYGLLLGLVFRWICRRAMSRPLWWAFAAYILVLGIKAEEGIEDVLNWITKAAVISVAVIYICPALRAALSTVRGRKAGQLHRIGDKQFDRESFAAGRRMR